MARSKVFSIFLALILAVTVTIYGLNQGIAAEAAPLLASKGSKAEMGAWYEVPLPPEKDRMQAVHAVLLPNGKVLILNGSSNRSRLEGEEILNGVDGKKQKVVDNTALFDPSLSDPERELVSGLAPDYTSNPFKRIGSPPTPRNGETNDPFCSGHVHLPDGNVLFAGGNRLYYPGGKFQGTKHTNLFNWKTNRWTSVGEMEDGRWYPSLVPLADGKIAIFSGLASGSFKTNSLVEFYDPNASADQAWQKIDLKDIKHSPFNTRMINTAPNQPPFPPSNIPDIIELYPRIFPTADGRFLITGDGGGKFPLPVPNTTNSYLMSIAQDETGKISVSFETEQPQRQDRSKAYGTALDDPNSDDILLLGGLVGTNDIQFGSKNNPNNDSFRQLGARIASSLERWHAATEEFPNGRWDIQKDFLGKPWAMQQAVILPSKEILVLEGGRYGESEPYFSPLLMTPAQSAPQQYATKEMNPANLPRLYHNSALLLPDARVLSLGGNPAQAVRDVKDGTIYRNTESDPNGFLRFVDIDEKGGPANKDNPDGFLLAEIWQAEIFSPPYLFKPGPRPEISQAPAQLHYGQSAKLSVRNITAQKYPVSETQAQVAQKSSLVLIKLGSITHDWDSGQRLANMGIEKITLTAQTEQDGIGTIQFTAPDNPHLYAPGYYMIFYLNELGKPSHAKMVQLVS